MFSMFAGGFPFSVCVLVHFGVSVTCWQYLFSVFLCPCFVTLPLFFGFVSFFLILALVVSLRVLVVC